MEETLSGSPIPARSGAIPAGLRLGSLAMSSLVVLALTATVQRVNAQSRPHFEAMETRLPLPEPDKNSNSLVETTLPPFESEPERSGRLLDAIENGSGPSFISSDLDSAASRSASGAVFRIGGGRVQPGSRTCLDEAGDGTEPVWSIADDDSIEHLASDLPHGPQRFTLRHDLSNAWYRLRDDTTAVLHPNNLLLLGLAGGGAIAMRETLDQEVRENTRRNPERWGKGTEILGTIGNVEVQVPLVLSIYYWSLKTQDAELHDFSTTLTSAFTITGVATVLLKAAANTARPSTDFNGGKYGFPSYHTSSSFTVASVLDEYYGPRAGIPAYTVAGLIAWSRIDQRDHDLSDVLFGAALGYVVGKSVAQHSLTGDSRVQVVPWIEPLGGTTGVAVERRW